MADQRTSGITFVLVVIFGMGSWVAINGLWSELYILIPHTVEQYKLTAYLTVTIQIANIGPIVYWLVEKRLGTERRLACQTGGVVSITLIGTAACILLSRLWYECSHVGGTLHSTALISLAFFLALVDCTSSVVFLPFLAHFPAAYLSALYVGEGLSGLIPSALALIQLEHHQDSCDATGQQNTTQNSTNSNSSAFDCTRPVVEGVRFQPSIYFGALAAITIGSGLAFAALRYRMGRSYQHLLTETDESQNESTRESDCSRDGTDFKNGRDVNEYMELNHHHTASPSVNWNCNRSGRLRRPMVVLLLALGWICALANGVLPAVSSYAYFPYGRQAFLLTSVAGILAQPMVSFLYFWLPSQSRALLACLLAVATSVAGYVLFLAADCNRPFVCQGNGTALVVMLVLVFSGCTSYLKVLISTAARALDEKNGLLWCGIATQVGSFIGAIITFALVEKSYFKESFQC